MMNWNVEGKSVCFQAHELRNQNFGGKSVCHQAHEMMKHFSPASAAAAAFGATESARKGIDVLQRLRLCSADIAVRSSALMRVW